MIFLLIKIMHLLYLKQKPVCLFDLLFNSSYKENVKPFYFTLVSFFFIFIKGLTSES